MIGRLNRKFKIFQWLLLGILSLVLSLSATATWAQSPVVVSNFKQKAPVVVDGRVLFRVSDTENRAAVERSEEINAILSRVAYAEQTPEIDIASENQLTTIRINGRHLLTVTSGDLREGLTPGEQARIWRQQLQDAFQIAKTERQPAYIRQAAIALMVVLASAIAGHLLLQWCRWACDRKLRQGLEQNPIFAHQWDELILRFIRLGFTGIQVGLWTAVIFYLTDLFPVTRRWRYGFFNTLLASLISPVFTIDQTGYSILDLLLLLTLSAGLWLGVRALTRLLKVRILANTNTDRRVQDVIAILSQYFLTFIGLIIILQIWGLDVSSLTIVASILGVGIGFGLQNIANNLISGLIITFERNIQVGDFVEVTDLMGTVERIGARSTQILTLDRVTIIVPNSRFLETEVINWSHSSPICRLHVPVGVAYGSDPHQVQSILLDVAKGNPDVLVNPAPQVIFKAFGDSSLNFELLIWTREPRKQFLLKSELYYKIEKALRQNNIEIPFPQRDLHLRSPQLDEALTLLAQFKSFPEKSNGAKASKPSLDSAKNHLQLDSDTVIQVAQETNLDELVKQMQGSDGVEIKDRWYRRNLYPACFIGAEALDWLMTTQNLTRDEALKLGQLLCDRTLISHVSDDLPFMDGYHFYRFSQDSL